MKCTSQYPANPINLDLNSISYLNQKFKLPVGYSDHSLGDTAPIVAVSKGALLIEKHFTLNKKAKGADHSISLEPDEFKQMVKKIRIAEKSFGKKIFILNKKIKKNRNLFLRYLTAIHDIKKGDIISLKNIGFMRGKKRKKGLSPKEFLKLKIKNQNILIKRSVNK